jgi:hypothetical protein
MRILTKTNHDRFLKAFKRKPDELYKELRSAFIQEGMEWQREQIKKQLSKRGPTTLGVVTGNLRRSTTSMVLGRKLGQLVLIRGFSDTPVRVSHYARKWENPAEGPSRLGFARTLEARRKRTTKLINDAVSRALS